MVCLMPQYSTVHWQGSSWATCEEASRRCFWEVRADSFNWSSSVDDLYRYRRGINPNKTVSIAEYEKWMKEALKEENGYVLVETSKEEAKIIEGMLGMSAGTLGDSTVKFVKGSESCKNCGRNYSFLDVVHTGLWVHEKQFMNDVLMGKYGPILNHPPPQGHRCFECDKPTRVKSAGYFCFFYGCG
jgi:hypothetical protein